MVAPVFLRARLETYLLLLEAYVDETQLSQLRKFSLPHAQPGEQTLHASSLRTPQMLSVCVCTHSLPDFQWLSVTFTFKLSLLVAAPLGQGNLLLSEYILRGWL